VYIKKVYTPPLKTRKVKNFIARWGLKFLKCKKLKCAFNFQDPRGACFLFCGGMFPTKVYLAIACILYASEE
jgi:hypothetical protein